MSVFGTGVISVDENARITACVGQFKQDSGETVDNTDTESYFKTGQLTISKMIFKCLTYKVLHFAESDAELWVKTHFQLSQ